MIAWPRLDYASDQGTLETVHLLLQLIGKLPLRLLPWTNHSWHVTLRMTPRGMTTPSLPGGGRHFTVELDFHDAALRVSCDTGAQATLSVAGKHIAAVHRELAALLGEMGLPAPLHGAPNEIADAIAFAKDERFRDWDGDIARRTHTAFLLADRELVAFRSLYRGKVSPSHVFWGSFDVAVTRFSGRTAPPHPGGMPGLPDKVAQEAYSHEVISAGFWPGNAASPAAAFYAYAYPTPAGMGDVTLTGGAGWDGQLGEFLLPYETARTSAEPARVVQTFLAETFDAAAGLLSWPPKLVVGPAPVFGRPPG